MFVGAGAALDLPMDPPDSKCTLLWDSGPWFSNWTENAMRQHRYKGA
jgi:hypothetical protein